AVVRGRPCGREAGLGAELVRPEADEDDEDERREQEEAEPERARQRPQGGDPPAAALARLGGAAAERLLARLRVLELFGLLDLGESQVGRLRRGGAGHPAPSR